MFSVMRPEEIRKLLKAVPFEPIRIALSDGRSILIRHPDQAVVSDRYLLIGLTQVGVSAPLVTPESGDTIARSVFWVALLHIVNIEPAEAAA